MLYASFLLTEYMVIYRESVEVEFIRLFVFLISLLTMTSRRTL